MPAGWAEEPAGDDDNGRLCGIRIGELLGVGELPHADVSLSADARTGPALAENIGFVPAGRGPEVLPLDQFGDATELLTTWAPVAHDKAVATLQP